jgi:hypothetical protein
MAQTVGYLQFTEYIRVPAPTVINMYSKKHSTARDTDREHSSILNVLYSTYCTLRNTGQLLSLSTACFNPTFMHALH